MRWIGVLFFLLLLTPDAQSSMFDVKMIPKEKLVIGHLALVRMEIKNISDQRVAILEIRPAQPCDVIVVGDMKIHEVLFNTHRLYNGTFLQMEKVASGRARKIHAEAVKPNDEVLLEVDGETPGQLPVTMEMVPAAISIRM